MENGNGPDLDMMRKNPREEKGDYYHIERTFRLLPHRLEGEGHFIAVLKRREDPGMGEPPQKVSGLFGAWEGSGGICVFGIVLKGNLKGLEGVVQTQGIL